MPGSQNLTVDGRTELAAFLTSRRARVTPREVGIPSGGRRRTPGLRREELATLAGISPTWYTYLEQGRDVRASPRVITALANALLLSDVEREHLRLLSEPHADGALADASSPEALRIPALLGDNPAYITDGAYRLLAWNTAAAAYFPGLVDDVPPNLARWVLTDPGAHDVLVDWADIARAVLARLRAATARRPRDAELTSLLDDVLAASAEVRSWWHGYDIGEHGPGIKRLRHPDRSVVALSHVAFQLAGRPETVLTIYSEVVPEATDRTGAMDSAGQ